MYTHKARLGFLLPAAALAGGVHSGDSGSFNMDTVGSSNVPWASATASFVLDTWNPCCSAVASGVGNLFDFAAFPAETFLAGDVRDTASGLPIPGAQLVLAPGGGTVASGPNGVFRLDPVTVGEGYQLSAQHPGHHTANVSGIEVEEHRPAFHRILLEPVRPPAVTGLTISATSQACFLDWEPMPGIATYRIRAAWDPYGYWSPVATTGQTQYETPLPAGVDLTRLFRVTAIQ